jgi:mono/diheme cytochrome c family protein
MAFPKLTRPRLGPIPRWVMPTLIVLAAASLIPLALIARARATRSTQTRIQIIPDMDQQAYYRPQEANLLFADTRAMRPPVEGTVPRGHAEADPQWYRGIQGGAWAEEFPMPLTPEILKRGQERFGIYCAPCHGSSGYGNGIVNQRAERLQEGTWTPASSLHDDLVVGRPVGHLFNTVTNGIRNMPAYGPQIPVADRWAVVAYVRALQRSQRSPVRDVPAEIRSSLR